MAHKPLLPMPARGWPILPRKVMARRWRGGGLGGRGGCAALAGGIAAAQGRFVIMGDSDDSYDFTALMPMLEKLREGYEMVIGNRFKGGIQKGAMPLLNRYLGNPVLSALGKLFFQIPLNDFHCGLRG